MSNAKVRHRRRRRAQRNPVVDSGVEYTPLLELDWCFEDTHAGRAISQNTARPRLASLFAVAALASLGVRL